LKGNIKHSVLADGILITNYCANILLSSKTAHCKEPGNISCSLTPSNSSLLDTEAAILLLLFDNIMLKLLQNQHVFLYRMQMFDLSICAVSKIFLTFEE
jgi:hypothetical protein